VVVIRNTNTILSLQEIQHSTKYRLYRSR